MVLPPLTNISFRNRRVPQLFAGEDKSVQRSINTEVFGSRLSGNLS